MHRAPFYICTLILSLILPNLQAGDPPTAVILSPDTSWCMHASNLSQARIELIGSPEVEDPSFDLHLNVRGKKDTLRDLPEGIFTIHLNNLVGKNLYIIEEIVEHQEYADVLNPVDDSLLITVHPLPDMSLELSYEDLCSPAAVSFKAEAAYSSYWWDYGDGIWQEGTENTFKSFQNNGSANPMAYDMRLKIESSEGCLDSVTRHLDIYISPEPAFEVQPETQYYPSRTVLVTNQTAGDWSYLWDYGDGSTSEDANPGPHELVSWGLYDITLHAWDGHCRDSVSKQVNVIPDEPEAVIQSDVDEGCPPLSIDFTSGSSYASSFLWYFGSGEGISRQENPIHTYDKPGTYTVSLVATGLAGEDSTSQLITIFDLPEAAFEADRRYLTPGEQVNFTSTSSGAEFYVWDFGDELSSLETSPSHIYEDTGVFTVSLTVQSLQGCSDTLVKEELIIVEPGKDEASFPSVFRWNGSGPTGQPNWSEGSVDNTVFHPDANNVSAFSMVILNRRGVKIWESTNYYYGWDGYSSFGELAPQGVYIYRARFTFSNGEEKEYMSDVTFLY